MICPLCRNNVDTFHKRSHTLPEWMYKDCYDQKHKILKVSRREQNLCKKQKGHYSSYICHDCEDKTQKLDRYASLILTERSPQAPERLAVTKEYARGICNGERIEVSKWSGINFLQFQQFVFSVILRCYFAEMIQGPIVLHPKHLNKIHDLYLNNISNDDHSYPIMLMQFSNTDKYRDLIIMPYFSKIDGHHVINFAGGGYCFNIYVSSHAKPDFVSSLSLKSNGTTEVVTENIKNTEMFRIFLETMKLAIHKKDGQQSV